MHCKVIAKWLRTRVLRHPAGEYHAFATPLLKEKGKRAARRDAADENHHRRRSQPGVMMRRATNARTVASSVHRARQRIGASEQSDEQGDEHGAPRRQTLGQRTLPEPRPPRPVRIPDPEELLSRNGNEAQRNGKDHRDVIGGHV